MIAIELQKLVRANAIASIQRYFEVNFSEPVGTLPAGLLLDFFLEEIGPAIYNRAVADVQDRLQMRIADLGGELYAEEFQYWPRLNAKHKSRR